MGLRQSRNFQTCFPAQFYFIFDRYMANYNLIYIYIRPLEKNDDKKATIVMGEINDIWIGENL